MKKYLLLLLPLALFTTCKKEKDEIPQVGVFYKVTSEPPGFDVRYTTHYSDCRQKEESEPSGEWTYHSEEWPCGSVAISAEAQNDNSSINVKIYYNGVLFAEASATGDRALAGMLPQSLP